MWLVLYNVRRGAFAKSEVPCVRLCGMANFVLRPTALRQAWN